MTSTEPHKSPKVSIVIINWKTWHHIEGCLNSLRNLNYPDYNIIVVDNASGDDSPDKIAAAFPEVTLLRNDKNLGTSGGNNAGMKYALDHGSDYVWFLNNDTIVPADTLDILVQSAQASPKIGMVSPVLYNEHRRDQIQYCGSSYDWKNFRLTHYKNLNDIEDITIENFWLWGTALLIKREVVESVGDYDEGLFVYHDDMEYAIRAIRAGYMNKIEPKASVYHKQHFSGGMRKLPLHYYYYITRNDYFVWMKYTPWYQKSFFLQKYLYRTLCDVAEHAGLGQSDVIDTCLDAMCAAFRHQDGAWDKTRAMPRWIKNSLKRCPYLWCDLAGGNWGRIIKSIFRKAGKALPKRF